MISAGLEGRLQPYMTYPEPWRGPPKPPAEFLRPAPKPVPPTSRYNGVSTSPNGTRLVASRPPTLPPKYPPSPTLASTASISAAVNLSHQPHKEDLSSSVDDLSSYPPFRLYQPTPHFAPFGQFYQFAGQPYPAAPPPPHLIRSTYPSIEPYSPTTPTFLSPPTGVSPFKVPSGKEGSLKHRILTRPEDGKPLDLQRRTGAALSPPRSPKPAAKTVNNNNPGSFAKGSLIQLASGELRRIEDMRTEDFVKSANHSNELKLADSTVVKIDESPATGTATIVLSYNERRAQVEVEAPLEHPFFVFGQGWASCSPERTQHHYNLKVHRLNVGDVLVSLTPRENPPSVRPSTVLTTATSTAMTVRPTTVSTTQIHPMDLHAPPLSPDRKRRWSAPDQICDDDVAHARKLRLD